MENDRIESTLNTILSDGVVLCIRLAEGDQVGEVCDAALQGGINILEITLTTPGALDAIARYAMLGDCLVGAGTVMTVEDVSRVADAGGRFVMSPVMDEGVQTAALERGLLGVPGSSTPSEMYAAHRNGARLVKVFPAEWLGGPGYLRTVRGPMPDIPLIPTSGPTAETIPDYMAAGAAAVGVGVGFYPKGFTSGHIEETAKKVRDAMEPIKPVRLMGRL